MNFKKCLTGDKSVVLQFACYLFEELHRPTVYIPNL